jgi:hypothetical protein
MLLAWCVVHAIKALCWLLSSLEKTRFLFEVLRRLVKAFFRRLVEVDFQLSSSPSIGRVSFEKKKLAAGQGRLLSV